MEYTSLQKCQIQCFLRYPDALFSSMFEVSADRPTACFKMRGNEQMFFCFLDCCLEKINTAAAQTVAWAEKRGLPGLGGNHTPNYRNNVHYLCSFLKTHSGTRNEHLWHLKRRKKAKQNKPKKHEYCKTMVGQNILWHDMDITLWSWCSHVFITPCWTIVASMCCRWDRREDAASCLGSKSNQTLFIWHFSESERNKEERTPNRYKYGHKDTCVCVWGGDAWFSMKNPVIVSGEFQGSTCKACVILIKLCIKITSS